MGMSFPRIIMHIDMNSYFASVEQQANPALRGKPVGVVATMTPHGCIIASSKEAKAVGIKTGCRVDEAFFLYPAVRLVQVDPPKYRSTTEKIFSILQRYSEDIEPYSIDEAFVNLTGYAKSFNEAVRIGHEIKRQIFTEAGEWLTNSIGIAPTRWLAKFGSDICEKGGIIVLHKEDVRRYLAGRELTEAWGIAERTAYKLNCLGITTLDELAAYSPYELQRVFGIRGYELWANVNGVEVSSLRLADNGYQVPKSIGHSHVLRKQTRNITFHRAVMMRLAERTGRKLRSLGLRANGIFAHAGLHEGGHTGESRKLDRPIEGGEEIFRLSWGMVEKSIRLSAPSFLSLGVFRLSPDTGQRSLLPTVENTVLSRALDAINDRFGEETIVRGTLFGLEGDHAPDRVGFRKTVEPDSRGLLAAYKEEQRESRDISYEKSE